MILDHLRNASLYRGLGPNFARAFDFLAGPEWRSLPDGRHEIDGQRLIALPQSYTTRPREKGRWEAHRRYADIQLIVRGREMMGFAPLDQLAVEQPYDPATDCLFLTGQGQLLTVAEGEFAVFLPQDAHMPCLAIDEPQPIAKIVLKVEL